MEDAINQEKYGKGIDLKVGGRGKSEVSTEHPGRAVILSLEF